jgi:pimeloyl-ACP methyl ester carboxylesterase
VALACWHDAAVSQPVTDIHPDDRVPRHDVPIDGRSGFVVVEDRQVHYLEWGNRGQPPVLCLHGGGQTAYMYEELGAALRRDYHVLAPDLPHHGDSDPLLDPEAWGRQALAETLPPLLEEFGFDRTVIVGASLGGLTALALAAGWPHLVGGIVLIDIGHRIEPEGVRKIMDFMRSRESFASLEEAAEYIGTYLPYRRSFRPESLTRNLRQRADGEWIWKHGMGRRFQRVADAAGAEPEIDTDKIMEGVEEDAAGIDVPVLLLRGGSSDVLAGDTADELIVILKQGRLETIDNAGHLAAGDNPSSTVNLVRGFLADLRW